MLKKWVGLIREEGLWRLFFQLGTAGVGSQVLALMVYPIISRLYEPEDFGIRATFAALFMLVLPFSTLNLEFAVPLVKDRKEVSQLFNTSIMLTLLLSLLVAIGVGAIYVGQLISHPLLPFLWLLPLAVFLGGCRKAMLGWATWLGHRRALVGSKYWRAGIKSAMELSGGIWNANIWLLVASQLGGILAMLLFLYQQMKADMRALIMDFRQTTWLKVLSKYRGYPLYTLPSTFADIFNTHFPLLFFGAFLSLEWAGQFSMAILLIFLVFSSIGDAFSQAYLVELGKYSQRGDKDIRSLFRKSLVRITLASVSICMVAALLGEPVLLWVLGDKWTSAAAMMPFLSLLIPVYFWSALCFHTLNKIAAQRLILVIYLLRALALVLLFFLFYEGENSAKGLVNLYVGNSLLFSLIFLGFTYFYVQKSTNK